MWQDDNTTLDNNRTWSDAITYCQSSTLGGYNDWRLPTIQELTTIIDNTAINTTFQNVKLKSYWSATSNANEPSYVWGINFDNGLIDPYDKNSSLYIRCVKIK